MIYLLAVVGALTIAVLLWRAFGPQAAEVPSRRTTLAPDDDPDFLRKLDQKKPRPDDEPPA
ncbi:hypothetical protein [Actinokineospora sp. HUAS TT18]|uniref:hypothetical protein n=1 Tax=Actinokineospora sp. HUAS TT18 TaxID=3447451 RepID=UPI003F51C290